MRNAIQGLGVDEQYETKFDAIADFLLIKAKIVAALLLMAPVFWHSAGSDSYIPNAGDVWNILIAAFLMLSEWLMPDQPQSR